MTAMRRDINWLGFEWAERTQRVRLFEALYDYAVKLMRLEKLTFVRCRLTKYVLSRDLDRQH